MRNNFYVCGALGICLVKASVTSHLFDISIIHIGKEKATQANASNEL